MNLKEFGAYFSKLRVESGFKSQRELAEISGVSHSTINRLESGTHKISPENLKILANYLKDTDYKDLMRKIGYLEQEDSEQTYEDMSNVEDILNHPLHGAFFRGYLEAPEHKKAEMRQFVEFILRQEKDRKPGQKQGE
ncbi:hypothetical protein J1TS5_09730 [Paenibacillus macerans]|uniref:helix-turn-helix domain-containing protein n=1 Tax=Paenibacillus macerans TaxID=44252 RepID=UPI001B0BC9B2|nr:helix-turn-helix domain-containing protein [Paenibacillus macerans]GIP08803.1 hypothetical protein J1TS5_09730 [Paenibacillus macerans]